MSSITVIAATTDAQTKVTFNTHGLRETVSFHASGLQGVEKITPYIGGSNGWQALYENGTQVFITATYPQLAVLQGANYAFDKDETLAEVSLDVTITS